MNPQYPFGFSLVYSMAEEQEHIMKPVGCSLNDMITTTFTGRTKEFRNSPEFLKFNISITIP
jgi:hypothetical protein